eukprot:3596417-Karenia_brevis.AAC.1
MQLHRETLILSVDGSGGSRLADGDVGSASWAFSVVSQTGADHTYHGACYGNMSLVHEYWPDLDCGSNQAEMLAM